MLMRFHRKEPNIHHFGYRGIKEGLTEEVKFKLISSETESMEWGVGFLVVGQENVAQSDLGAW